MSYGGCVSIKLFVYCMRILGRKTGKRTCGSRLGSVRKQNRSNAKKKYLELTGSRNPLCTAAPDAESRWLRFKKIRAVLVLNFLCGSVMSRGGHHDVIWRLEKNCGNLPVCFLLK